jgi:hypothetical protein
MRANVITWHFMRSLLPRTRAAGCGVAVALLTAFLITSTDARAGSDATISVEGEALAQIAVDALSQGVAGPGSWEQRAMLVGLGVVGLHLGASSGPIPRNQPRSIMGGATYRLVLPVAGAALGSLVSCHSACDSQDAASEPLLGAIAGALVAHVLAPDTSPERQDRLSRDAALAVQWTPVVSLAPGSYSVGITGRF